MIQASAVSGNGIFFETDRLRLRKLTENDWEFIITLLNTPDWLRFIGDRNVHSREDALSYLRNGPLKSYTQHGYGLSMVETKHDGRPVGMCGILHRSHLESPDIGFAFLPEFYGQGYGLEIVKATVAFARRNWNIGRLLAITLPENLRSITLLGKAGFRQMKITTSPEDGARLLLLSNEGFGSVVA